MGCRVNLQHCLYGLCPRVTLLHSGHFVLVARNHADNEETAKLLCDCCKSNIIDADLAAVSELPQLVEQIATILVCDEDQAVMQLC